MIEQLTVQGASITGTSDADNFTLEASDITLDAGDGHDIIVLLAQRALVTATGDNEVYVSEEDNTLTLGDGDNTVMMLDDDNALTMGNGNNQVLLLADNVTLTAGDGANEIEFNGSRNVLTLGDGGNTVEGASFDDSLVTALSENNSVTSGDGADLITVSGSDNYVHAGNGNDTVIVDGDGNMILGGYPTADEDDDDTEDESPSTIGDDDVMTVRGNGNVIDAGAGRNVLTLEGRNNTYAGAGSDTIRASASNSTLNGAVDVEIDGDNNVINIEGGRLISRGNDAEIELTNGAEATINGNQLQISIDDSRMVLESSDYAVVMTSNATIDATTLTGASFLMSDGLLLNGRQYNGTTILRMIDGVPIRALALNTPLEGFEGVEVDIDSFYGSATIDGRQYEVFTVPSATQSDDGGIVTTKDREISALGWSEAVRVLQGDTYTVNGSLFELTPEDTVVGTNDWAGLLIENTVDNIVFEGTVFNDRLDNYGAGVTVDGGIGTDHISLGSAAREFVVFDEDNAIEVEGFATGFDSVSDVLINSGDMRDFRFDFGVTGVHITQNDAEMDLINSGYESVDFLLQNGDNLIKFTAINSETTLEAGDADFYALNDRATLYAGEDSFIINGVLLPDDYLFGSTVVGSSISADYEFTEFVLTSPMVGEYTVHGISYDSVLDSIDATGQFYVFDGDATVNNYSGEGFFNALHFGTDGRATVEIVEGAPIGSAYKSVKSITGIAAGDHLTVGSMVNNDYVDHEYTVSADGTSIVNDRGELSWSGSDVTTLNLMDVYDGDVLEERLRDLLLPVFYSNVTADDEGLHVNLAGFRQAISARISEFREKLLTVENPTADDVITVVDEYLTEKFGLVLSDVLNETTIELLKDRLTTDIAEHTNFVDKIISDIDADGLTNYAFNRIFTPFVDIMGIQNAGLDIETALKGGDSTTENFLFDLLMPRLLSNERAVRIATELYQYLRSSMQTNIAAATGATNHINIVLEGTAETVSAGLFIGGGDVIDASTSERGLIFDVDGENKSIIGSAQRDLIFAGAGATIDAGAGVDDYVVLSSGSSSIVVNEDISSTITGLMNLFDAYIERTNFEDAHTRENIVLSSVSSVKVFGFETGFDVGDDVIIVDGDVNSLQFAFDDASVEVLNGGGSMRFATGSDVSADVLLQSSDGLMKATAINGGRSIEATGADRYYIGDGATVTNFNGSAGVNHFRLETNGALNVVGKTVEGDDGAELKIEYIGGMRAGDTIGFVDYDGSNPIVYAVNADGTAISRTDKNMVAWTGTASELATLNLNDVDDIQYDINAVEESLSETLGRDVNLIVSVVDGDSVVGSTGDDMIFAGANDTVNGNGGSDEIYLTPSTIAPDLDQYADGDGARQYIALNGDSTVYGFDAGTAATNDMIIADAPYSLRADDNGLVVEDGENSMLLAGVNADALIMIGDEIASIESGDDTTSETPIDDTTSEVPIDDTTSEAPIDDTTSEVPVDTDRFVDNSADDIDVTLTSAKVGVIESEATGSKIVTAGDRMTTLENYAASADVTLRGSARNDLIIAAGGNQVIDLSLGGRDTLDIETGSIDVVGYDVTTKSGFVVDGVISFDGNGFSNNYATVKLDGDHSRGVFTAFLDADGNRQLYGWNDAESVIDGSAFNQSQYLMSDGWSTIVGGSKDDTIEATGGDIIQLTRGHDLIVIDDRQSGEVTIDLGTHLTHTTVEGFGAGDIVKVEDVSALKVKDTDDGLSIRAGNAHLMLDGVSDTVRVTDGNNEFVLRTDYRDLVPTAAYMLEDQSGIVRTPNGTLEIDDDIFTFNGGDNVAIDGFDDRWQLRAGDGVEVDRMTTLVNGTIQITTTDGGRLKVRK